MFTPIVIFIIYITFSFGIIAIDAYIRKKYENTMREIEEAAAAWREEQKALRKARREARKNDSRKD